MSAAAKLQSQQHHSAMSSTATGLSSSEDNDGASKMSSTTSPTAPFLRSQSLVTGGVVRPAIPTGNMLTEALMQAAADRKRRKKSVSASIRLLASDHKPILTGNRCLPAANLMTLLTTLIMILIVLVVGIATVTTLYVMEVTNKNNNNIMQSNCSVKTLNIT